MDVRKYRIARLWGFCLRSTTTGGKMSGHGGRNLIEQAVLFENMPRVVKGAGIWNCGARADGTQVIIKDIRQNETDHRCWKCEAGKIAAFDPGEVFPDNVEFVNVGPTGEQQTGHREFVCEGETHGWTDEEA
jgi:hypothetical protein